MKCPWNEWKDCLKEECPYYGKKRKMHRPEGGTRVVTVPICRAAEEKRIWEALKK